MNVSPYYEHAMRQASQQDQEKFRDWTGFLPFREEATPYHSEAHSIRNFRMALQLCGNPSRVFEIGFCLGHSAAIMLELGVQHVDSCDVSDHPQTMVAADLMRARFGGRFDFQIYSSERLFDQNRFPVLATTKRPTHDMAFIDGAHDYRSVKRDVSLVLHLKIPFILMDDFFLHWSDGVQPVIQEASLIPIAILGSMALCVPSL